MRQASIGPRLTSSQTTCPMRPHASAHHNNNHPNWRCQPAFIDSECGREEDPFLSPLFFPLSSLLLPLLSLLFLPLSSPPSSLLVPLSSLLSSLPSSLLSPPSSPLFLLPLLSFLSSFPSPLFLAAARARYTGKY